MIEDRGDQRHLIDIDQQIAYFQDEIAHARNNAYQRGKLQQHIRTLEQEKARILSRNSAPSPLPGHIPPTNAALTVVDTDAASPPAYNSSASYQDDLHAYQQNEQVAADIKGRPVKRVPKYEKLIIGALSALAGGQAYGTYDEICDHVEATPKKLMLPDNFRDLVGRSLKHLVMFGEVLQQDHLYMLQGCPLGSTPYTDELNATLSVTSFSDAFVDDASMTPFPAGTKPEGTDMRPGATSLLTGACVGQLTHLASWSEHLAALTTPLDPTGGFAKSSSLHAVPEVTVTLGASGASGLSLPTTLAQGGLAPVAGPSSAPPPAPSSASPSQVLSSALTYVPPSSSPAPGVTQMSLRRNRRRAFLGKQAPLRLHPGLDPEECGVCGLGDGCEEDPLVFCDGEGCDVAVHQQCYAIGDMPAGDWFCDACQARLRPDASNCSLCPVAGGALKQVYAEPLYAGPTEWVHVACSLWVPEVYYADPGRLQGAHLEDVDVARKTLKCCGCHREGYEGVIQCCLGKCTASYHVLCARNAKWLVTCKDTGQPVSFCQEHSGPRFIQSRNKLLYIGGVPPALPPVDNADDATMPAPPVATSEPLPVATTKVPPAPPGATAEVATAEVPPPPVAKELPPAPMTAVELPPGPPAAVAEQPPAPPAVPAVEASPAFPMSSGEIPPALLVAASELPPASPMPAAKSPAALPSECPQQLGCGQSGTDEEQQDVASSAQAALRECIPTHALGRGREPSVPPGAATMLQAGLAAPPPVAITDAPAAATVTGASNPGLDTIGHPSTALTSAHVAVDAAVGSGSHPVTWVASEQMRPSGGAGDPTSLSPMSAASSLASGRATAPLNVTSLGASDAAGGGRMALRPDGHPSCQMAPVLPDGAHPAGLAAGPADAMVVEPAEGGEAEQGKRAEQGTRAEPNGQMTASDIPVGRARFLKKHWELVSALLPTKEGEASNESLLSRLTDDVERHGGANEASDEPDDTPVPPDFHPGRRLACEEVASVRWLLQQHKKGVGGIVSKQDAHILVSSLFALLAPATKSEAKGPHLIVAPQSTAGQWAERLAAVDPGSLRVVRVSCGSKAMGAHLQALLGSEGDASQPAVPGLDRVPESDGSNSASSAALRAGDLAASGAGDASVLCLVATWEHVLADGARFLGVQSFGCLVAEESIQEPLHESPGRQAALALIRAHCRLLVTHPTSPLPGNSDSSPSKLQALLRFLFPEVHPCVSAATHLEEAEREKEGNSTLISDRQLEAISAPVGRAAAHSLLSMVTLPHAIKQGPIAATVVDHDDQPMLSSGTREEVGTEPPSRLEAPLLVDIKEKLVGSTAGASPRLAAGSAEECRAPLPPAKKLKVGDGPGVPSLAHALSVQHGAGNGGYRQLVGAHKVEHKTEHKIEHSRETCYQDENVRPSGHAYGGAGALVELQGPSRSCAGSLSVTEISPPSSMVQSACTSAMHNVLMHGSLSGTLA
eukprot:jgi/Mesvir1/19127/Mv12868-RA.1